MRTSDAGVALIKAHEGFVPYAYDDFRPGRPVKPGEKIAGTLTIGYGSTGPHVRAGMTITEAEGETLLRRDLATAEKGVAVAIRVPLQQREFDALVSFAFNVGVGALSGSTLARKLNAGDRAGAAAEFPRWNRSKGRVLPGLSKRRAAERALFLGA